ncbi:MAG: hypothetical protein LBQ22_07005 [Bacteroidales bacterium]|jgi:hypothetical protein|nr:hypothetical protein [Bacteroidales bacterium]
MKVKINIILITFLLFALKTITAQEKVTLSAGGQKQQRITVDLSGSEDNKLLLKLPITFQITDKNILIMILGDGNTFTGKRSVWLFSSEMPFETLQKNNLNVNADKHYKNKYKKFRTFFNSSEKIKLYKKFDNDYEIITANPKPVFFQLAENSKSIELNMEFYISQPGKKYPHWFIAKSRQVTIKININ